MRSFRLFWRKTTSLPGAVHVLVPASLLCLCLYLYFTRLPTFVDARKPHLHGTSPRDPDVRARPLRSDDAADQLRKRVSDLPDSRHARCKQRTYDVSGRATIVTHFHNYELDDLKITVASVQRFTPRHLYDKIVVIDDGSTLEGIREESDELENMNSKLKVIRLENQLGVTGARQKALHYVNSSIVVFLDSSVVVSPGWLEPLIDHLLHNSLSIVMPHLDSIQDSFVLEYKPIEASVVSVFTWSLAMHAYQLKNDSRVEPLPSPALRTPYAVRVDYLNRLGGLDFVRGEDAGYELIELSLRAWLCGGALRVIPCSRVATFEPDFAFNALTTPAVHRLGALWIGEHMEHVLRSAEVSLRTPERVQTAVRTRRAQLRSLTCSAFSWYMRNVATHLVLPSRGALRHGFLRCRSARCAVLSDDKRLALESRCVSDVTDSPLKMFFEFGEDNRIRVAGQCLTVQPSAHILAESCAGGDIHQEWNLEPEAGSSGGRLRNPWSNFCMMHVTDPDRKNGLRQIAMAQECVEDPSSDRFQQWDFVE